MRSVFKISLSLLEIEENCRFLDYFCKNYRPLLEPENRSQHFSFLFSKFEIWIPYFSFSSRFHFLAFRQCLPRPTYHTGRLQKNPSHSGGSTFINHRAVPLMLLQTIAHASRRRKHLPRNWSTGPEIYNTRNLGARWAPTSRPIARTPEPTKQTDPPDPELTGPTGPPIPDPRPRTRTTDPGPRTGFGPIGSA